MINEYSCGPECLGKLLGISYEAVIKHLGHDGSEIVYSDGEGSERYRGFHIQEFQDVCRAYGYLLAEIEVSPYLLTGRGQQLPALKLTPEEQELRLYKHIARIPGLLIGKTAARGWDHMCYWDGNNCWDPQDYSLTPWSSHHFPLTIESAFLGIKSN